MPHYLETGRLPKFQLELEPDSSQLGGANAALWIDDPLFQKFTDDETKQACKIFEELILLCATVRART